MSRMQSLVLAALLVMATSATAGDSLLLRIRQAGDTGREYGCYIDHARIPLQLEFANTGEAPAHVTIVDHDSDGNRQRYPNGLQIRVVDSTGRVLTAHGLALGDDNREWWTIQYLSSTSRPVGEPDMPGSTIEIAPGESLRRVYHVALLAAGCNSCPVANWQFAPGTFLVELRLDELQSNQYKVLVLEEGHTCE